MSIGTDLLRLSHRTIAIERAISGVIMCHDWMQENPSRQPINALRALLAEAIEHLKAVRHV